VKHQKMGFFCDKVNCGGGEKRIICRNKECGFRSLEKKVGLICRLCSITERNSSSKEFDVEDL